ncbi:MAG TPA: beta-N-acetylhexosaminidase [Firmicutes bacterium]|nr:beta-N-acetylhexosaminidase [Bacillota bacterium]
MKWSIKGLSPEQEFGVQEILEQLEENGCPLDKTQEIQVVCRKEKGIHLQYDGEKAVMEYGRDCDLMRGIGLLAERLQSKAPFSLEENPSYQDLGMMIDCSRNAVPKPKTIQKMLRHLALMGYSTVQLYTEDTFEMEGHPYFGYLRGRYTREEFHEMDRYAKSLGIEMIPCIQTLAHMGAVLKWNAYAGIKDCNDIMLIGDERTYQLIDEMFRTMSENLSSRRINIGMDEAHMVGLGKYLDQHGFEERFSVMLRHFQRVMEIARKYGYRPMMWSDMFFRLACHGDYYNVDCPIDPAVVAQIPEDISLIYWDYYTSDSSVYNKMIEKHRALCKNLVFAGGAWKWMGFSPHSHFSHKIALAAHESCRTNGVTDVFVTGWGDDGGEASLFSVLPALQLWAELCYQNNGCEDWLKHRFTVCTGGHYNDFMDLDLPHTTPDLKEKDARTVDPGRYLFYQDVLYGLFDRHVEPDAFADHYRRAAERFAEAAERNPGWEQLFHVQSLLCEVLCIKCRIGIDMRAAYRAGDLDRLAVFSDQELPSLRMQIQSFMETYTAQWEQENKVFGLDVFDLRSGGVLQRIRTAERRIRAYLDGELKQLEELDQDILYYDCRPEAWSEKGLYANTWYTIATPSVLCFM